VPEAQSVTGSGDFAVVSEAVFQQVLDVIPVDALRKSAVTDHLDKHGPHHLPAPKDQLTRFGHPIQDLILYVARCTLTP
jgi:hypothetical protein